MSEKRADAVEPASPNLAAIVEKARGETAIAALRSAGVYDPDRRVVEYDDETLAVPVTEPPEIAVLDVVRQQNPERRTRDLADHLRERGWTDEQIETAPSSWAVVGTVVLVEVPAACHDEGAVGEALLALHREADTVLAREGVTGQTRQPARRVLAGVGDTETVHTEHGVQYALDLGEVLFSPGNEAERARIGALVGASDTGADGSGTDLPVATIGDAAVPDRITDLDPVAQVSGADGDGAADGDGSADDEIDATDLDAVGGPREHVFDMFAGAGYFTLPAAIAGAHVTAAEIDPNTFGYLIENAQLNGVGDRVSAYVADCRDVADVVEADRVVMGHYDAAEYLDAAFDAVRGGERERSEREPRRTKSGGGERERSEREPRQTSSGGGERERSERESRRTESSGGVVHYHEVAPEPELPDRPRERLASAAERAGRSVEVVDLRRVKSYGEGVWHVVADAQVR